MYTEHGIANEPAAFKACQQLLNKDKEKLVAVGLVICRRFPIFAYSPDGIVLSVIDKFPKYLIEIKCPYDGKPIKQYVIV